MLQPWKTATCSIDAVMFWFCAATRQGPHLPPVWPKRAAGSKTRITSCKQPKLTAHVYPEFGPE